MSQLRTITLDIDSQFRVKGGSAGHFTAIMDRRFTNVVGSRIQNAIIPYTFNAVDKGSDTFVYELRNGINANYPDHTAQLTLPHGNYTGPQLATEMTKMMDEDYNNFNPGFPVAAPQHVINVYYTERNKIFGFQQDFTANYGRSVVFSHCPGGVMDTDERFGIMIGLNTEKANTYCTTYGTDPADPFVYNDAWYASSLIGATNQLYISSPTLYDNRDFATNAPDLKNIGIMAKIPIPRIDPGEVSIEYLPTESQTYTFAYMTPRSFDTIEFIIYRKYIVNGIDINYDIIDFGGKNVNITVELSIMADI